jgi:prepilin-type N-terminal cleavage/methylation domain-containing protein
VRSRRANERGFTLLEILIALVIFVGSIAAVSRLVTLGLDSADFARLQSEGALLIENRFAEIDADLQDSSGETDDMFPGWTCQLGTESTGDFLYKITATATHTSGVTVAMTRLFFDEAEAEEAAAAAAEAAASSASASSSSASTGASAAGGS